MNAERDECPNCGDRLISHRTDRQVVSTQREVLLSWFICVRCGHVALREWSVEEQAAPTEAKSMRERRPHRPLCHGSNDQDNRRREDRRQKEGRPRATWERRQGPDRRGSPA
ncbi:MAG: hypothetical protein M3Z66_14120 [Chloroflexota bacterium]|nr:hypothetical protein [Chloroflexota bacterium]